MKIYYGNGETEVFPADIIPGFPVVVVKENERIVRNGEILSKTVSENIEETNLIFVDEIFNNLHGKDLVNTKTRANRLIDLFLYLRSIILRIIFLQI